MSVSTGQLRYTTVAERWMLTELIASWRVGRGFLLEDVPKMRFMMLSVANESEGVWAGYREAKLAQRSSGGTRTGYIEAPVAHCVDLPYQADSADQDATSMVLRSQANTMKRGV